MSIEQQIVDWALSRPLWQRSILRRIAMGESIGEQEFASIVDQIVGDGHQDEDDAFEVGDLPAASTEEKCTRLLEISDAVNVNALAPGQKLTFSPANLTVIYGDNASGKSGYARIIKHMVRARHHETILSNIFGESPERTQMAKVVIQVNNERRELNWPQDKCAELAQVAFFDEACGDAFITSESEVSYRPSALFVLDGLIQVCDRVRVELSSRIERVDASAAQLPAAHPETRAGTFLEALSAESNEEEIQILARVPDDLEAQISQLMAEEARLQATGPSQERKRLLANAVRLERLATHMRDCERTLDRKAQQGLFKLWEHWIRKQEAAAIASERSFDKEPLPGVGSAAWRDLWEAARRFASEACPGHSFPVSGPGARCVFCHQVLAEEASERLQRFESFVQNETQRELDAAAEAWETALAAIKAFVPLPADVIEILTALSDEYSGLVEDYRKIIAAYSKSHSQIILMTQSSTPRDLNGDLVPVFPRDLESLVQRNRLAAEAIDEKAFTKRLQETTQRLRELVATKNFSSNVQNVVKEVERLRLRQRLVEAKESTETRTISKKSAELTREYVTSVMCDRFTRETDRLRLERVTLKDVGARKGSLRHQPAFVGAVQPAKLPTVLSEGEQTAISLAGFLTEVYFDSSRSAVVLDDPVSSLDHVRRAVVADRLAELSRDRQVIVFTHDIAFVTDIRNCCDRKGLQLSECSVERRGSGQPGVCRLKHPWKAKDVGARLQELNQDLATIRRELGNWDRDRYERETAEWAGKLSETWERMINHEIVGQVVDRGTQEVRPKMFRVLAQISENDNQEFQAGYSVCSRWARRHDKSVEINYVAPEVGDMDEELEKAKNWYDRMRKYRNL